MQMKAKGCMSQEKMKKLYQNGKLFKVWDKQALKVKKVYPEFDIHTEINNETFKKCLNCGLSVKLAYEVTHDLLKRG